MFYGAVVVEVGAEVLNSHRTQGFITRSVTNYLNLAGLAALGIWGWELASGKDRSARRCWLCRSAWFLLAILLAAMALLHVLMDRLLDEKSFDVLDESRFAAMHGAYLCLSTVQWAISLLLTIATLGRWRDEDALPRS